MGTIYQLNELTGIEFQIDSLDVLMQLQYMKQNQFYTVDFQISHTELNKIIGNIQGGNENFDIYSILKIKQIDEKITLYSFDFKSTKLNHNWVSDYQFKDNYKEIRA